MPAGIATRTDARVSRGTEMRPPEADTALASIQSRLRRCGQLIVSATGPTEIRKLAVPIGKGVDPEAKFVAVPLPAATVSVVRETHVSERPAVRGLARTAVIFGGPSSRKS